ncbi:MAG: AbrB family transcriptional regulator [Candidatus Kapabacteria bacterium]|nr:AbrB family transcriptional regulator [Candidatus Kapabacteria bacterium]
MKCSLRKIGNSRGIIIPASFLKECSMKDIVNIEVVDQSIVITAQRSPRQGWFESPVADESVLNSIPPDEDTTEWVWE